MPYVESSSLLSSLDATDAPRSVFSEARASSRAFFSLDGWVSRND